MKYLTIGQYKRFDDGMALGGVSDLTLALMISRAEADIDSFMGFDIKRGGFEPHVVTTQYRFDQDTLKTPLPSYPIPVRQITRYRIHVSNLVNGSGFFANISPNDCVINEDEGYIEIVPLQAISYSLAPALMQLGLQPPIVMIDAEVGFFIPVLSERCFDGGDHQTYYAMDGFWATSYDQSLPNQPNALPPVPPVIYKNGTAVTSGLYTFDAVDGSVTFTSPNQASDTVTIDYTKTIPDYVVEAAILQTSHLLGQRALNKLNLQGLEYARTGDQDVRKPRRYAVGHMGRSTETALCEEAMSMLVKYESWGVA